MQAKSEAIIWPNFFTSMFQVRVRFEERMNVLHSERTVENSTFTVALQPKTSKGEHNNANAKAASRGFYLWSGKRGAFHFHFNTFDSIFFSLQNSFALWGVRPHHSLFSKRKKFNFLLQPQNILALPFLSQKRNECFPNVSSHLLAHDLPSAATYCRANCRRVLPEVLICQQWNAIERKVLTKNWRKTKCKLAVN